MSLPVNGNDQTHMAEALRLAARIPRRPWPNPPVGAVVVNEGRVVGRGSHHGAGTNHAEVVALGEAGERARGGTLYCTLEPCNHTGRTPPCAPAVLRSGVARVVVALNDPNPAVTGGGNRWLAAHGVTVEVGLLAEAALELIWPFVVTEAFGRPFVLLKTATSLDGRFSVSAGSASDPVRNGPVYLTGEPARGEVHRLRRWSDLVLVGEETVRVDRPRLDTRLLSAAGDYPAPEPAVGYVDTDLSFQEGWSLDRYWVFGGQNRVDTARSQRLVADGGKVVRCPEAQGHVDPAGLVAAAFDQGFRFLMVEGGPRLAMSLLAAGLVDRWIQYLAPVVAGAGLQWPNTPAGTRRFVLTSCRPIGVDLLLVYDRCSFASRLQELTASPAVSKSTAAPGPPEGGG